MGISKIKTIQSNGTWDGDHGLMYKSDVELEDGEAGEVSAKKPDRWKVGDEVEYTVTQGKHGNRLSLTRPGFKDKGMHYGNSEDTKSVEIRTSWAISRAVEIMIARQSMDWVEMAANAERLIALHTELKSKQ